MFSNNKIKNNILIDKNIIKVFIVFFLVLTLIIVYKKKYVVADGKNDLVYDVENGGNVIRKYNNVAVFGDSRLSPSLYTIPTYKGVTYYTFEGFNLDDMIYFFTGMFIQDSSLFVNKLSKNVALYNTNLDNLKKMYNTFLIECKDYDKIIVQVGVNSIHMDPSLFQGKYMQFINLLHEKCPKATMYLVKIFGFSKTFPNYQFNNSLIKKMNDTMFNLYNIFDYIQIIKGNMTFINDSKTYEIKDGYADDGIHINNHLDEYYEYINSIYVEAKVIKE